MILLCKELSDPSTALEIISKKSRDIYFTYIYLRLHQELSRQVKIVKEVEKYQKELEGKNEDKIVQLGIKKIIEAIYESKFLNCMYGFRSHRGCHNALKALNRNIKNGKVNYVVDAEIKGFFDHVNHEWLIRCINKLLWKWSILMTNNTK